MKQEQIVKVKESASFIQSLDNLVNASINGQQEFRALMIFNEQANDNIRYSNLKIINYCLDKYNEGFNKHESLMGTYILISSGKEMADKFFYHNMVNPYIDNEYLEGGD